MRASPESFSRTRLNAGGGVSLGTARASRLPADREAGEAAHDDVLAGLAREVGAQLLDRLVLVLVAVDVRLLEQDGLLHPLAQLALGDLRPHLLGLVGSLLLEDAQL